MNQTTPMPAIFLSHGSPMLAVQDSPAGRFLDGLGNTLPRPKAIVVASAHFIGEHPGVGAAALPATVHDFGGFPAHLYDIAYPAPGEPELVEAIARRLGDAGLHAELHPHHGIDHGVWVPLRRMYPHADIPVVPISVNPMADAAHHFRVGHALATLRDEGVLVIGSGGSCTTLANWTGVSRMHRCLPGPANSPRGCAAG